MITTQNLRLVPHEPRDLFALLRSAAEYEQSSQMRVADGVREFLLAASPEFVAALRTATGTDPWKFGFAIVHKIDNGAAGSRATSTGGSGSRSGRSAVDKSGDESINLVIGLCGFTGPPDATGAVEIAYSIAPAYQGRGYATEATMALVEFAASDARVRIIRAHTLPETNASTRVLEKCGFSKTAEIRDPENNLVWQWEKRVEAK